MVSNQLPSHRSRIDDEAVMGGEGRGLWLAMRFGPFRGKTLAESVTQRSGYGNTLQVEGTDVLRYPSCESPLMPTVLRVGPYRFFFYASDREEPAHVHIEREDKVAKFWLDPIRLQESGGFSRQEISRIHKLVTEHQDSLREAWNEYFGG